MIAGPNLALSRRAHLLQGDSRGDPARRLPCHLGDRVVVAVVVDEHEAGPLRGGRDQQVGRLHAALVTRGHPGEGAMDRQGALPIGRLDAEPAVGAQRLLDRGVVVGVPCPGEVDGLLDVQTSAADLRVRHARAASPPSGSQRSRPSEKANASRSEPGGTEMRRSRIGAPKSWGC